MLDDPGDIREPRIWSESQRDYRLRAATISKRGGYFRVRYGGELDRFCEQMEKIVRNGLQS